MNRSIEIAIPVSLVEKYLYLCPPPEIKKVTGNGFNSTHYRIIEEKLLIKSDLYCMFKILRKCFECNKQETEKLCSGHFAVIQCSSPSVCLQCHKWLRHSKKVCWEYEGNSQASPKIGFKEQGRETGLELCGSEEAMVPQLARTAWALAWIRKKCHNLDCPVAPKLRAHTIYYQFTQLWTEGKGESWSL